MTEQNPTGTSQDRRWAPWWLYVVVIVGANYARQMIIPFGTVPEWADVVLALALAAALFVAITAAYRRATRR